MEDLKAERPAEQRDREMRQKDVPVDSAFRQGSAWLRHRMNLLVHFSLPLIPNPM
jgi:hypothetical protein